MLCKMTFKLSALIMITGMKKILYQQIKAGKNEI